MYHLRLRCTFINVYALRHTVRGHPIKLLFFNSRRSHWSPVPINTMWCVTIFCQQRGI